MFHWRWIAHKFLRLGSRDLWVQPRRARRRATRSEISVQKPCPRRQRGSGGRRRKPHPPRLPPARPALAVSRLPLGEVGRRSLAYSPLKDSARGGRAQTGGDLYGMPKCAFQGYREIIMLRGERHGAVRRDRAVTNEDREETAAARIEHGAS